MTTAEVPEVERLLAAAAVAGGRVRLRVLAAVLDLSPAACLAAVDEASRRGFLVLSPADGEAWFADEDLRVRLEEGLTWAERADLHRRTAEALGADTASAGSEVTRHFSAAAGAALDPSERARLQLRLAAAATASGELELAHAAAADAMTAARQLADPDLLAAAATTLRPIGDAAWDGDLHAWCEQALATPGLSEASRVRLLSRQAQAAIYTGRNDDADQASATALERAEKLGEPDLLVEALTARQLSSSGPDETAELLRLSERMVRLGAGSARAETEMWGHLWRADALWYDGDLAGISAVIPKVARCVERIDRPEASWHLLVLRAALALARADFDSAERLEAEALGHLDQIGHPAAHGASVAFRLVLGHHQGPDPALLEPRTWDFGTDARWGLFAHLGRAMALADADRVDEAMAEYRRCGRPDTWADQVPRTGRLLLFSIAARVAVAVGAVDDIAGMRDRMEPYRGRFVAGGAGAANFLGPVELALGVCAAALGDTARSAADLRLAAARCHEVGAAGFAVEAQTLLGECLVRAGDRAAATALAREALPLARSLGMAPWQARLGQLVSTSDPLSAREGEIAGLVADGLSNKDIASRLVISERTAANHVQHILGKLGFTKRAQIASWYSRHR